MTAHQALEEFIVRCLTNVIEMKEKNIATNMKVNKIQNVYLGVS